MRAASLPTGLLTGTTSSSSESEEASSRTGLLAAGAGFGAGSVGFVESFEGFADSSSSESSLIPAAASIAFTLLRGVSSIGDFEARMAGEDAVEDARLERAGVEGEEDMSAATLYHEWIWSLG